MTRTNDREIREGLQQVGLDERPVYSLTTTPWGSSPTSITVKAWKYTASTGAYTDVSSSVFPTGSPSAAGDVITLPAMVPQTEGDVYRIEVKFTSGGSVFEPFAWVIVKR